MPLLKLMAVDAEDLKIMSSFCQDAVVKIADIQWLKAEKRFIITFNRFVWEKSQKKWFFFKRKNLQRRQSVLQFARVQNLQMRGFDPKKTQDILALLMLDFQMIDAPNGIITLVFSGDAAIRLEVECIEGQLSDLGAAWQASSMPSHD